MSARTILLVAASAVLVAGCSDEVQGDKAQRAQPVSSVVPASDDTLLAQPVSSVAPASDDTLPAQPESSVAAAPAETLPWSATVPLFVGPPSGEAEITTTVDEEGRRCLGLRWPDRAAVSSVCVDEPETLALSSAGPDTEGTVYLFGFTSSQEASYVVVTAGEATVRIELRSVDDWNERAFAAPLPFTPEMVELRDSDHGVIASQHA